MAERRSRELEKVEWHDLPVSSMCFREDSFEIVVTSYDEQLEDYTSATLRLWAYESIEVDVQGRLSRPDQANIGVHRFDYELDEEGLLSGELGLLPGVAGFWRVAFTKAAWTLEASKPSTGSISQTPPEGP
ncbi:MAG: hypothetical protein ACI9OJ_002445 [Myxococcota bacterium]|jgi:hypothetical protein